MNIVLIMPMVSVPKSVHDNDRIRIFDWMENFIPPPSKFAYKPNISMTFLLFVEPMTTETSRLCT